MLPSVDCPAWLLPLGSPSYHFLTVGLSWDHPSSPEEVYQRKWGWFSIFFSQKSCCLNLHRFAQLPFRKLCTPKDIGKGNLRKPDIFLSSFIAFPQGSRGTCIITASGREATWWLFPEQISALRWFVGRCLNLHSTGFHILSCIY